MSFLDEFSRSVFSMSFLGEFSRCVFSMSVLDDCYFNLPHEIIDYEIDSRGMDEVVGEPGEKIQKLIDAWAEKTGVESNDQPVVGVGVWGDTAPYGTRDSLAVLLFNILGSVQRYWFCVFSKRTACACGCKG